MKHNKNILNRRNDFLINPKNLHVYILYGSIIITCIVLDYYYQKLNLFIPFIITTLITSFITYFGIPKLKEIKVKQIIRKEGPKAHHLKAGTPTMGGLMILLGVFSGVLLWGDLSNP